MMVQKPICLLLLLSPLMFGQEFFGCCPLKEVQGEGDLSGVYYLVETDQPFPDVCSLDDCTYKKEGNTRDSIFCFKPSTRYASTCLAIGEGYASGEPTAEPSGQWPLSLEPTPQPTAEPSAEPSAEPTAEPTAE